MLFSLVKLRISVYYYTLAIGGCGTIDHFNGFIHLLGTNEGIVAIPVDSINLRLDRNNNNYTKHISLSLEDSILDKSFELIVYHNPSNGQINLMMIDASSLSKNCRLAIYNHQGSIICEQEILTNKTNNLNLNAVSNGVYFIKVQCADKLFTKVFVKFI